jgi:hypothetical protein
MADPTAILEQFWPQQNLVDIHTSTAWDHPTAPASAGDPPVGASGGHADVYVCVIDNGVQLTHVEINRAGNVGWDLLNAIATTAPLSLVGEGAHATASAGIAVAEWGSRNGVVGIGPKLSVLSIAVPQPMTAARLVNAINEARTHAVPNEGAGHPGHRRVILLSGGFQTYSAAEQGNIQTAINNAISAGIPVCVATGNGNAATGVAEAAEFPATAVGVLAVGAVRLSVAGATRANAESAGPGAPSPGGWSSNYDATTEFVVAPGRNIPTTDLAGTDGYNTTATNSAYILTFRGTQAAAAHVAGVAALLFSHNPELTVDDMRSILCRTAEKLTPTYTFSASDAAHPLGTWHQEVGYGRVHADDAVLAARKSKVKVEVILNGSGTSVNFVDVVYISAALSTTAATIRLSHDNLNMASPVEYNLPAPPANFIWDPATPANPIVVTRGNHVDVNLLYQPPSATNLSTGNILITTGQDHWTASVNVSVSGNAVAPPVVQTVMVLDRSGSMAATAGGYSSRSEAVVDAADLFITLMGDADHLGIVRFDNNHANPADRLIQMTLAGPLGSRTALRDALTTGTPLAPAGSTSIAGGMQLGMEVLEALANPSNHKRAMLVMTDGHHNTAPNYPAAIADINAAAQGIPRVFALGVGLDVIDSEFDAIVTLTKGYAYQTGTVVTDTKVQELFSKILRDVVNADFADDPAVVVLPGQSQATAVTVGDTDYQVDFIILFGSKPPPTRKRALIALEAPDGTVIDANDIVAGTVTNMAGESRPSHIVLRCRMPAFADPKRHLGAWKVIVKNAGKDDNPDIKAQDNAVHCTLMTMVKSNLRLKGHLQQSSNLPGQPIGIVAEPTLYGAPVKLATDPVARLTRPDGVVRLVPLIRNEYGAYVGTVTDTGLTGVYDVDVEAVAVSPAGITLKRFLRLQTTVKLPGQGTGSTSDGETPEGGSRPDTGRPSLWCRFWCRFFCLDCRGRRRCC